MVPDFQSFMLPLLNLASDGNEHSLAEAIDKLAHEFQLSDEDRRELLPSGRQPRVNNRIGWALTYLRKASLLSNVRRGSFQITDRGRAVLADGPSRIDLKFLQSRFTEIAEFRREEEDAPTTFNVNDGTWALRTPVTERISEKIERAMPDEVTRRSAMEMFAFAVENADEERSDAWYVRETSNGLRLMTGGLLACEVARKKLKVSVIGPISDETRSVLGADVDDDEEFLAIPGGVVLTMPIERCGQVNDEVRSGLNNFVDMAMARVRRASGLEHHVPEAVAYVGMVVGRELPQPEPAADTSDDDGGDEETSDPRVTLLARAFAAERSSSNAGSGRLAPS